VIVPGFEGAGLLAGVLGALIVSALSWAVNGYVVIAAAWSSSRAAAGGAAPMSRARPRGAHQRRVSP
jgi:hypothetical protein